MTPGCVPYGLGKGGIYGEFPDEWGIMGREILSVKCVEADGTAR